MKRIFEAFSAIIILITVSPLFIVITLLVKLTSKGPVFFVQRRVGKDKIPFNILKFRTMSLKTDPSTPTHLLQSPERYITSIGKFLRKTSLDELPQLINIINGDMSFIGPRPALYNQYDLVSLRDKYGINSMMPGLTGWAQINGRDELDIDAKVLYDKYYFENQSFLLDVKIILKTFVGVAFSKGIVEGAKAKKKLQIRWLKIQENENITFLYNIYYLRNLLV